MAREPYQRMWNRILALKYSSAADESEVEAAIAGFRQTAEVEK